VDVIVVSLVKRVQMAQEMACRVKVVLTKKRSVLVYAQTMVSATTTTNVHVTMDGKVTRVPM
jgi:hypothetical protein|tara:strand:+ start:178 stop:363 length:186 start_codon:yes stop_codon:yes gene_type:complete